jgi:hypothetical protein
MSVLSKFSFGRSSRLLLLLLVLTSTASCSKGPLSLLTGGGPNIAANVQAGKTNTQTVGTTNNIAPTVSVRPNARVDNIDQSNRTSKVASERVETVVVNEVPVWVVLLLILGWLLPSPNEIGRWIRSLFRRK